jgi:catechol 2,3-dioxygenase-like lactoylglutathione lyase family enzyme
LTIGQGFACETDYARFASADYPRCVETLEAVMLESAALVCFIGVSDLDRAQHFYGDLLGLPLMDERPFALVAKFAGATLRITVVDDVAPAPYTVLGWSVSDLNTTIDRLVACGVSFTQYQGMDQDTRGAWTTPGGSRVAWFLDPDGNNLSLTEFARLS